jgi:hypothetical protein
LQKKNKRKKKEKLAKKKKTKRKNTVDYCCNPQCFVCGGTVNPPHGLVYLLIEMREKRPPKEKRKKKEFDVVW